MTDWSNSSMSNIYNEVAKKMTQTTTYHLAATFIMDKNFPNRDDLPPVIPPHFNNFGHQLFLDYSLLLKIIWQVIDDTQQSTKKLTRIINFLKFLLTTIIVVVFMRLAYILNIKQFDFNKLTINLFIFGAILGVTIYLLAQNQQKKLHHKIAKVRAKAIEQLHQETWHSRKNTKLDQAIEEQVKYLAGDGVIRTDQIPVIVIVDKRYPFPGYGSLLTDELFVCPPKKIETDFSKEKLSKVTIDEISETVDKSIKNFVSTGKIQYTNVGYLAVLHGKSLSANTNNSSSSKWLERVMHFPNLDGLSILNG